MQAGVYVFRSCMQAGVYVLDRGWCVRVRPCMQAGVCASIWCKKCSVALKVYQYPLLAVAHLVAAKYDWNKTEAAETNYNWSNYSHRTLHKSHKTTITKHHTKHHTKQQSDNITQTSHKTTITLTSHKHHTRQQSHKTSHKTSLTCKRFRSLTQNITQVKQNITHLHALLLPLPLCALHWWRPQTDAGALCACVLWARPQLQGCVCLYVCVCVCVCVCVSMCACVHMCVSVRVYVYVR